VCDVWSRETDQDLGDPAVLAALLLRGALDVNEDSIIIFFSRRVARIEANMRTAEDATLRPAALRLWELARARWAVRPVVEDSAVRT
jgi:hypothetical protein